MCMCVSMSMSLSVSVFFSLIFFVDCRVHVRLFPLCCVVVVCMCVRACAAVKWHRHNVMYTQCYDTKTHGKLDEVIDTFA